MVSCQNSKILGVKRFCRHYWHLPLPRKSKSSRLLPATRDPSSGSANLLLHLDRRQNNLTYFVFVQKYFLACLSVKYTFILALMSTQQTRSRNSCPSRIPMMLEMSSSIWQVHTSSFCSIIDHFRIIFQRYKIAAEIIFHKFRHKLISICYLAN